MTENEKLLAGMEYDYKDPEIQMMLRKARILTREFNELGEDTAERKSEIIKELLGCIGKDGSARGSSLPFVQNLQVGWMGKLGEIFRKFPLISFLSALFPDMIYP